jgi:hypothetical protein
MVNSLKKITFALMGRLLKKRILERYARTDDGTLIIDVAASRIQDLYNDFDKTAPYLKRDLDQDLVDYLTSCAQEIGKAAFIIRIKVSQKPAEDVAVRVKNSMRSFFLYLKELENRKMASMLRTSLRLFAVGIAILIAAVWANRMLAHNTHVIAQVFAEGLTVAAWVALWEALATFLIEWTPEKKNIALYQKLAEAAVILVLPLQNSEPHA